MTSSTRRSFWGNVEVDPRTGNVHVAPSSYFSTDSNDSEDLLEQIRRIGELARKMNNPASPALEKPVTQQKDSDPKK